MKPQKHSHHRKRGKHSKPYPVSGIIIEALSKMHGRESLRKEFIQSTTRSKVSCGTHQGFAIKAHRPTGIGPHFLRETGLSDGRIFRNRPVFFVGPAFTTASQIFNSLTSANLRESISTHKDIQLFSKNYAQKLN